MKTIHSATILFISFMMLSILERMPAESPSRPWNYKVEMFGSTGWGSFYHGDHQYGGGFNWSGGIGIRPFSGPLRGIGFEVEANGLNFRGRPGTEYESQGHRTVISGNALYHFGRGSTQFFLLGGIGAFFANYHHRIPDFQYQDKGNKMSLNLGLGVKARLNSHLSIRPEFRLFDTTIGSGYNWLSPQFSCGVSYHW